jgi:hypothetical protein
MSKRDIERLKELLDLGGEILRKLDTLSKIQATISYLIEKYFTCEEDCEGLVELVKRIREWLRIYECVEKHELQQIMDLCLDNKASVDYNTIELEKICVDLFECVYLNVKLPLNEDGKKLVLDKVKEKLQSLVDKIDLSYSKTLIVMVELLRDIEHDLKPCVKATRNYTKRYSRPSSFFTSPLSPIFLLLIIPESP